MIKIETWHKPDLGSGENVRDKELRNLCIRSHIMRLLWTDLVYAPECS